MLLVDKHRPKTLAQLDYHPKLTQKLMDMAHTSDFPHLLFYGPPGAGKKTRIMAFLKEIYGPGVMKLRVDHREFKTPTNKKIELTTVASAYHIEINASDAGHHDRFVVQEVIKEIAQSPPLDNNTHPFKVVVLNEVDELTKQAQHGLRRTMEKYMAVCRIILCCNSTTKVIEPLRSRCLGIRVPAPTTDQISEVLQKIARKESLTLPESMGKDISLHSQRNLRRAILMFEATKVANYPFKENQRVEKTDWEEFVAQIATQIINEQSPRRLLEVRNKLYELLSHCIPPEVILKSLVLELFNKLDSSLKVEVTKWAAHYEHQLQRGNKPIFHLEAFVAKFMSIYKRFLLCFM